MPTENPSVRVRALGARLNSGRAHKSCNGLQLQFVRYSGTQPYSQATKVLRIGYISPESADSGRSTFEAFRDGLKSLGYAEPRQVVIDARFADGPDERLDLAAVELVQSKPDVIVTQTRAVFSVRRTGTTIPVVFGFGGDPVLAKLVRSLARPEGNYAGLSMLSLDLTVKRMELSKENLPRLKRVAIIANPGHAGQEAELHTSQAAAQALGLAVDYHPARDLSELEDALASIRQTASLIQ